MPLLCEQCSRGGSLRRGMMLLVVLVIIALLALLGASFSFRMNADLASVNAQRDLQQARLAAESGIDRAISILRDKRTDMDQWYNNPRAFRRILVWAPDKIGGSESLADQEEVPGRPAWRYSVISYKIEGDTAKIRYGLTDEASKINLNTASRAQLLALFDKLKHEDVTSEELADALLDWRDDDDTPISVHGAESAYYATLNPPYKAKNKPLETVEELLMVKGFNGRILYGEDYNRNGYLDANEDDGPDGAFPPDNGDGILDRGLLPLVTVYSWDWNLGNDNKLRININVESFKNPAKLPEYVTRDLRPEVIDFIAQARQRGYKFKSVGDLMDLQVYEDGTSNHDRLWRRYLQLLRQAGKVSEEEQANEEEQSTEEQEQTGSESQPGADQGGSGTDSGTHTGRRRTAEDRNQQSRDRQGQGGQDQGGGGSGVGGSGGSSGQQDNSNEQDQQNPSGRKNSPRRNQGIRGHPIAPSGGPQDGRQPTTDESEPESFSLEDSTGMDEESDSSGDQAQGSGAAGGKGKGKGTPIISPVTAQDLPGIVDRLTTMAVPAMAGLINVNTAPAEVLRTIPGLSEQDADTIVAKRQQFTGPDKLTTAWVVNSGAVTPEAFALISNQITTRSIQFTIDAIGFGDHVGASKRLQVVVEMRGQLSQIKYYRDISSLGLGYPIRDDQRSEGFAFADR